MQGRPEDRGTLRKWKYDSDVEEYFVEVSDTQTLRQAEIEQVREEETLPVP